MTITTTLTDLGLDALLAILSKGDVRLRRAGQQRVVGDNTAEVFVGDDTRNVVDGGGGNDILIAKGGDDRLVGGNGNDQIYGGDGNNRLIGGNGRDNIFGGAGNDFLNGGNGNDNLSGGTGNDTLIGGAGNDELAGGSGVNTLTGGAGRDRFVFDGNVFANGTPAPAGLNGVTGINALNQPSLITDFTIGEDQFALNAQDLGLGSFGGAIAFQKGQSSQIGNGNIIVLTDPFPAAGAAARAIANNPNITADEGIFVYFNTTLQLTRVVYSTNLADGGDISVLANLTNQTGPTGLANINNFTANDFILIAPNSTPNRIDQSGDVLTGDANDNTFDGGAGDDFISGKDGKDNLTGGTGNDTLVGGNGVDTLTGGVGRDKFVFDGDVFANGTPTPAPNGINVLGQPDVITDYTIGEDQIVLNSFDLGIPNITFQKGQSNQITNGNVIVLTDSFTAAPLAARAIANNPNITAQEGVFVYFNSTLGFSRVVYSKDLANGGDISVLGNLTSQSGPTGLANIANFTAADFSLA
jgi:Ca2+-binding RTX toxin-like protein